MPGTALHDLDLTDIDTLFPWYLWKIAKEQKKQDGQIAEKGDIVYRNGKPCKIIDASEASWL